MAKQAKDAYFAYFNLLQRTSIGQQSAFKVTSISPSLIHLDGRAKTKGQAKTQEAMDYILTIHTLQEPVQ